MNILLWLLQAALAFLYVSGGAYKLAQFDEIVEQMSPLSRGGAGALGVFEILAGLLLLVPAATKWMSVLTPLAAAALTLESLALAALYARHSLELAATNPLVWAIVMALLTAFVAYARYARRPVT